MESTDHILTLLELLKIEQQADFEQYQRQMKQTSINERKAKGLCWYPLRVVETGFGVGAYPTMVLSRNRAEMQEGHAFKSGAPVALFLNSEKENEQQAVQGMVDFVDEEKIKITLYRDDLPDWLDDGKIGINLLFDNKTYDEMRAALNTLYAAKGEEKTLREVVYGGKTAGFFKMEPFELPDLNDSQQAAVQKILATEHLAAVHGPPGTGKTTTLVAAIRQLCKREKQILVCAPSNAAVDYLVRKLSATGLRVVRIGNPSKIEEDIADQTVDSLVKIDPEFKQAKDYRKKAIEFRRMANKYKRSFGKAERDQRRELYHEAKQLIKSARDVEDYLVEKMLNRAQVLATTLIGANHFMLKERKFKTVVIDEAGQGLEPATWVAILKAEKVIMAGDPFQLPPTVKSSEAARKGFNKTLIEKVIEKLPDATALLNVQYRMHDAIMHFSNVTFYQGELHAHESIATHLLFDTDLPLEFIDTAGTGFQEEKKEGSLSKINPEEAIIVRKHLETLPEGDHTIGVISPYREQVAVLRETIGEKENLVINTIDSFQGQERDVIYISMVRSNDAGDIGFLKDYRRMNVAMTRARKKLVIIGDSATLGQDKFYSKFLAYAEENGFYRSAWEFADV